MSSVGIPGPHSVPHFNDGGFCVCACDQCTMRGAMFCVCLDCPCDYTSDQGGEHTPDDCGELETGYRVVAVMHGNFGPPAQREPPSWVFGPSYALRPEPPLPSYLSPYGTYCAPVKFYRIRSREEIAADERREAAGMALAVLRKPRGAEVSRRMSGQPCGSCVLGPVPRLLPLGFPLAVASAGG